MVPPCVPLATQMSLLPNDFGVFFWNSSFYLNKSRFWIPLAPLGSPWVSLGCPWVLLGLPWFSLGLPWVPLGSPLCPLCVPLGPLLGPLASPWVSLGPLGSPLSVSGCSPGCVLVTSGPHSVHNVGVSLLLVISARLSTRHLGAPFYSQSWRGPSAHLFVLFRCPLY